MKNVTWGEFKLDDLFRKIKVNPLNYKTSELPSEAINEFVLPALTAGIQNQGLNNFVPVNNATILKNVISISANGANTGATFYQNKEFTVLQDAYAIKWKYTDDLLTDNHYLYLTVSILKTIFGKYEWTNKAGWERIKPEKIQLPTNNDKIDFEFMESFIGELKAEHIVELEAERIAKLESYLLATELKDYALTVEEQRVLKDFENGKLEWSDYRIEDVLQWQSQKEIDPLTVEKLKDESEMIYPFYGQATTNKGIISYHQLTNSVLNNKKGKPTILIHSNNQNIVYLESPFYLKDGHGATSVLQSEQLNKINQMFIIASIDKVIKSKYSYNNKATKIELKNTVISLPTINHQPNYEIMETFIFAIQKLVIKDVVLYADKKIAATKSVVKK